MSFGGATGGAMMRAAVRADILLATDLGHRCDRAFDRALLLAHGGGNAGEADETSGAGASATRLLIIHALAERRRGPDAAGAPGWASPAVAPPWYRPPPAAQAARARIYRDLARADPAVDFRVRTRTGAPADVILEQLRASGARLVVTGIASSASWSRLPGDGTIARLIRKATVPILMVRDPVDGDYGDLLLTTDFSAPSAVALAAARRWFPAARLTLFHAYDVPYGTYLGRRDMEAGVKADRAATARRFLAGAGLTADEIASVRCILEYGAPAALLRNYHAEFAHHLTIVGTTYGGVLYDTLIGSTGRRIVEAMPGDIFFVPEHHRP